MAEESVGGGGEDDAKSAWEAPGIVRDRPGSPVLGLKLRPCALVTHSLCYVFHPPSCFPPPSSRPTSSPAFRPPLPTERCDPGFKARVSCSHRAR